MPRLFLAMTLCLPLLAQAASLKDHELSQLLQRVARDSSVGTPRAINQDILDRGYSVDGNQLVNHLSVRPAHAAQMRANPEQVRAQLSNSVCANDGYRRLLAQGALLRYEFSELRSNRPIASETFHQSDCMPPD